MAFWRVLFALLLALGAIRADHNCGCPPFWTSYRGNCYRFIFEEKSWSEAEEHCKEFFTQFGQGHLASVHNDDENDFLYSLWPRTVLNNAGLWLGGTDKDQEGTFIWTDGTEFDNTQWGSGEPNDSETDSDTGDYITFVRNSDTWRDADGDAEYHFICKVTGRE